MKFTEQIYSKTSKIYWHGSKYPEYNKDLAKFKYFFLTPDFEYAARYCIDKDTWYYGYMYACSFVKPLNIFNPRDSLDEFKFKKRYNISSSNYDKLKREHWLDLFGKNDRNDIIDNIKNLGYEGFFNFEYNQASIGIFDVNNIKINRVYKGKEVEEFIDAHKDLVRRKTRQLEDFKESVFKIIPSLLTREELIDTLGVEKDFEKAYNRIIEIRRSEKLERAKKRFREQHDAEYILDIVQELDYEDIYDMLLNKGYYRLVNWEIYD